MDFVNELKKRGHRITSPREVICNILETAGHEHFTVEKLHNLALKKDQNIDLATVYRTLELLEKVDIVEHSHQVHGSGIYYLKSEYDNNHIICDSCNSISDLKTETKEKINKILIKVLSYKKYAKLIKVKPKKISDIINLSEEVRLKTKKLCIQ